MLPADYKMLSSRIRRVGTGGGPTNVKLSWDNSSVEGQRGGEQQSAQVNPLIIWIGSVLPAKTGRTFLPGVSEDDLDEMIPAPSLVTAMEDFVVRHQTSNSTDNLGLEYVGCIWRREDSTQDIIAAGYVSPLVGTQRRRLRPV